MVWPSTFSSTICRQKRPSFIVWFLQGILEQHPNTKRKCTMAKILRVVGKFHTTYQFILLLALTTYLILSRHFITWNQKLRCSPETFRLSFYGIQGVPKKKFELLTYHPSKDPGGKFCFQLQISKIWAPIELKFFWGHPGYYKSLTWKFQDCTTTFDSV